MASGLLPRQICTVSSCLSHISKPCDQGETLLSKRRLHRAVFWQRTASQENFLSRGSMRHRLLPFDCESRSAQTHQSGGQGPCGIQVLLQQLRPDSSANSASMGLQLPSLGCTSMAQDAHGGLVNPINISQSDMQTHPQR